MSAPDLVEILTRTMCEDGSPGLSLAYKVEDFARLVHGEKLTFRSFTQICQFVSEGKEIPGFSKSDFNCRAFSKEKVCELLEAASSLLFKLCLPYFVETKSLHSRLAEFEADSEKEVEEEEEEVIVTTDSTLKLTQELAEAQRKIISLQDQVILLKDEIRSAESSAVTKTVQRDLKNYSAVLSQNCAVAMAPRRIQHAVRKAAATPDVEDRSCNLMIFGLPEESGGATVESSVRGVLDSINERPALPKCSRVGVPADGKVRPVVVTLNSREVLLSLLKKARELKASTTYSRVFLEPDRTPEQRAERKKTLRVLSELRRTNPDERYVIRRGVIECA